MGNKSARSLLVQSSMQFIRRCEPGVELHAWALRVAQRSGYNRARVALARKLAILMLAMWKNDAPYLPRMVEVSSTP